MSTDLKERSGPGAESDERSSDRIQDDYDRKFAQLTDPEQYNKSASDPNSGQGGSSDNKSLSSNDLFNKEANANKPAGESGGSRFGNSPLPNKLGGDSDSGGLSQKSRSRVGKLLKNKFVLGGAIAGGGSIVMIILFIVFVVGLFKLPNLAEHITAYQFARLTRDYALRSDNINATKIGIDSADDSVFAKMKERYAASRPGQAQAKAAEKWAKLDKYRPQKTIDNMGRTPKSGGEPKLKYNYEKAGISQRRRLASVTLEGKTIPIENLSFKQKLIPGYKFKVQNDFAKQFRPALRASLASNDIGIITRTEAMRKMRQKLGISLIAWHIDKYKGKSAKEARLIMEKDNYKEIKGGNTEPNPKLSDATKETTTEAQAAEAADVDNPKTLQYAIDHPGEPTPGVLSVLRKRFQESAMQKIFSGGLGFINPLYAIAAPLCFIYEGSLINNGDTVNKTDEESQRAFVKIAAAGSQVKDGYDTTGEAAGAMAAKVGNIEQSNPEKRAAGIAVDTTKSPSSQSGPTGEFTIVDGLPAPFNAIVKDAATFCPVFTNTWVAVGIGAANVVLGILSGGSTVAVTGATKVAAEVGIKAITTRIISKVVAGVVGTAKFGGKIILYGGATASATFLAQWVVLSNMQSTHTSPLESGKTFVDNADAGGNSHASNAERTILRGAPLAKQEVALNNIADAEFRADNIRSQSAFQRYLAVSNADSLTNNFGSSIIRQMNGSWSDSMLNLVRSVVNPARSLAIIASALNPSRAMAATTDTYNYGNVQFGFTAEETRLIRNNITYSSNLENQRILDESGKEDEIAAKFGPCYDLEKGMGDLLTEETGEGGDNEYYIVRDEAGDVSATKGLCSQANVGPHSIIPGYDDLVFRWRVAGGYDNTLAQLDEQQNPTATDTPLGGDQPADNTPTTSDGPIIEIDPGHSGTDKSIVDPTTKLIDHDYPNHPEMEEAFTIATNLKKKLEADGYTVFLTKSGANDTVSLRQRADKASADKAALAVSIHNDHAQPFDSFKQVYVQKVGLYRQTAGGQKVTFDDAAVATKSQKYGDIFKTERASAEGGSVTIKDNSFDNRPGLSPGNLAMVQLFSKVPWVYNEVGGRGFDSQKYETGLYNSIKKSIPLQ